MNTVILFGSKYGCTEKCAMLLKVELNGQVDVFNLKNTKKVDLTKYDNVIIGGSVYIGKIRKEVSKFINNYKNQLLEKQIGLFICGLPQGGDYMTELNNNFPQELLQKAKAIECFGGEFILEKMKPLERFMLKKIAKVTTNQSNILFDNIHSFALKMK